MGVQVSFNYQAWCALFPEFTHPGGAIPVTKTQAEGYFAMATGLHRNDGGGPVADAGQQLLMLNWLTAHFAKLFGTPAGGTPGGAGGFVGRITNASEGSVSVAAEYGANVTNSQAFFVQTRYGAAYWQMALPYRMGKYFPNPKSPVGAGILPGAGGH